MKAAGLFWESLTFKRAFENRYRDFIRKVA